MKTQCFSIDFKNRTGVLNDLEINELPELMKYVEGSNKLLIIRGDMYSKKFMVDGKVVKIVERVNGIPVKGMTLDSNKEVIDLVGKVITAYKAIKELWLAIKRLF